MAARRDNERGPGALLALSARINSQRHSPESGLLGPIDVPNVLLQCASITRALLLLRGTGGGGVGTPRSPALLPTKTRGPCE